VGERTDHAAQVRHHSRRRRSGPTPDVSSRSILSLSRQPAKKVVPFMSPVDDGGRHYCDVFPFDEEVEHGRYGLRKAPVLGTRMDHFRALTTSAESGLSFRGVPRLAYSTQQEDQDARPELSYVSRCLSLVSMLCGFKFPRRSGAACSRRALWVVRKPSTSVAPSSASKGPQVPKNWGSEGPAFRAPSRHPLRRFRALAASPPLPTNCRIQATRCGTGRRPPPSLQARSPLGRRRLRQTRPAPAGTTTPPTGAARRRAATLRRPRTARRIRATTTATRTTARRAC